MHNLIIEKPGLDEISPLLNLWQEQYEFHNSMDPTYYVPWTAELEEKSRGYLTKQIESSSLKILAARLEEEIVGFVTFETEADDYLDANISYYGVIKELLVTDKFRSKGIGTHLVREAEQELMRQGIKAIMIQCSAFNENALALYPRLGYTVRQQLLYKTKL